MSIIVTDTNFELNLAVYHYSDDTPLTDREKLNVRGIVRDTETGETVVKTFGYTPEVLSTDHEKLNEWIAPLVRGEETKFYKSYEGTLLRVWSWQDQWFLSTHRKLDAYKSRWGSNKSYGELFNRAVKPALNGICFGTGAPYSGIPENRVNFCKFTSLLQPSKIYVFLLRSFKENRKVCEGGDKPQLYCVGAFDRDQNFAFTTDNAETRCPTPEQVQISSADELVEYVDRVDPKECQGIVIMNPDGTSGKVVSPKYDALDKLRGNVPNVLHRYVQLRWQPEQLQKYRELYPEFATAFAEWEDAMQHICSNVLRKYIERYINHNTAILPREQYTLMTQLHQYYMNVLKPQRQRAEMQHIWEILGKWQERDVNVLFKEYQSRKRQTGNGNLMTQTTRDFIMQRMNRRQTNQMVEQTEA